MSIRLPYQCIKQCGGFLVAARGSDLDLYHLKSGSYLSTWKSPIPKSSIDSKMPEAEATVESAQKTTELQTSKTSSADIILNASSPPAKRRKLSVGEETDKKVVVEQGKKKPKSPPKPVEPSPITALTVTNDEKHVIAVTGEDKAIRVLEWQGKSSDQLGQISERCMPKRPCALVTYADDTTIISADKFGDVYSLPLVPTSLPDAPQATEESTSPPPSSETQAPKFFQPAASNLTVHSVRNLKALESQKQQKQAPEKTGPSFEHKLLLGHVSMLTDVAVGTSNGRNYILTADRDEHIRVTRASPQTHVIHCFCLGHTDFVSRLCIPSARPEILISGGGDDELFVWDWANGSLLSKVDIKSHVEAAHPVDVEARKDTDIESGKIAVTGIYHVNIKESGNLVIVTCEGVPFCIIYSLTPQNQLIHVQTLEVYGNALSVILSNSDSHTDSNETSLIVAIDTETKPWSTNARRSSKEHNTLQRFKYTEGQFVVDMSSEFSTSHARTDNFDHDRWCKIVYGVGNLRKMEGDEE